MKFPAKLDFRFQAFHQKYTTHECIKLCAIPDVVVYLTFCQKVAHFFVDESLYNFYSLHIHQCNILPASCLVLASHLHTCAYLARESLVCCSRVACKSLVSCLRVAHESIMSCSRVACESLAYNLRALVTLWLICSYRIICPV